MTDTTDINALIAELGAMTIRDAGWKRVSGNELIWVGQPLGEHGGRDALQLKGHPGGLAIATGYLVPSIDADDPEAVAGELEWDSVLDLPALWVLRDAVMSAIAVLEAAEAAKQAAAKPALSVVKPEGSATR
jgi:hypothetical protein